MKMTYTITVRTFEVLIKDQRTGHVRDDRISIDKQRLQACQMVGQSSKELIERIYNRQGYQVLDIGPAIKQEVTVDLGRLCEEAGAE